jgi:hypothetical protein
VELNRIVHPHATPDAPLPPEHAEARSAEHAIWGKSTPRSGGGWGQQLFARVDESFVLGLFGLRSSVWLRALEYAIKELPSPPPRFPPRCLGVLSNDDVLRPATLEGLELPLKDLWG